MPRPILGSEAPERLPHLARRSPAGAGAAVRGLAAIALLTAAAVESAAGADLAFRRGDSNGDGAVDISDGIATLVYLFSGGRDLGCLDAADADDSGTIILTDPILTFSFLFGGGASIAAPGHESCGPDPTPDALSCDVSESCSQTPPDTDLRRAGHVLHRIAYGPTTRDLDRIGAIGLEAYIEEQLHPEGIDESDNSDLSTREDAQFEELRPSEDTRLVAAGSVWRFHRGSTAPPSGWNRLDFDDSSWEQGPSGFGYGDGDDRTVLYDMRRIEDDPGTPDVEEFRPGYLSVFLRRRFDVADPAAIDALILSIDYDDGFVAYLNGTEIARRSMPSGPVAYNRPAAEGHEAEGAVEIDVSSRRGLLEAGANVLAIQAHNIEVDSTDFSVLPELIQRVYLPGEPLRVISGIEALQRLLHIRGIYSRRQLQAVLGEFWENHFTTDYDKLYEHFADLRNSDETRAMSEEQARAEAAQVEYEEYQFFYENALGNFGDLLLYSATSPSMLVYLDNVLNNKRLANENYSREIFELFGFGVDNGYTQRDIEQLAKCFTGWTICKVLPEDQQPFPASARTPAVECGVRFEDSVLLPLGAGWRYFKGRSEPSPGPQGEPTTAWTGPEFDDASWLPGRTGIGYGDRDDATVLTDMPNSYVSVYLRRQFTIPDPAALRNLILEVSYDDGFVCYLNGVEVARSESMEDEGAPPPFDEDSDQHEVEEGADYFNLNPFVDLLRPAPETNILAFQVHNVSLGSTDLSLLPRLLDREILPGSVENGDRSGRWVFRFNLDEHDTTAKVLFQGTPYRLAVPANRTGESGVLDAIEVIDAMVQHPSTAEFICLKLIQKFVSDEISLGSIDDGSAPAELRELLADMTAAWFSTSPPGNIRTVMRTLLDPAERAGAFWSELAYRAKVKTPIEFLNSAIRALDARASGAGLPAVNESLGMHFFTRDDPDGWSEKGSDWFDTAGALHRMLFAQELADNSNRAYTWDVLEYMDSRGLDSAEEIVDHVDRLLYQNTLDAATRSLLLEFLGTTQSGVVSPLNRASTAAFRTRVEEFFELVFSMPQFHFQ